MQVNQEFDPSAFTIRSYDTGNIVIYVPASQRGPSPVPGEPAPVLRTLRRSFIVTPSTLIDDWSPQSFDELVADHFESIAALQPALVLLGTGSVMRFPHPALTAPLIKRGIGVETMTTAAACRTYNFLVSDGRDVAVAIMMI